MKKLLIELKPYKWQLAIAFALGAIISASKAIIPRTLQLLIDDGWNANPPNKDYALYIPLLIAGIWLISGIARYFHLVIMRNISETVSISFRRKLMEKYLNLNMNFHQSSEHGSASLISKMMNDILVLQNGVQKVTDFVKEPFLVLFTFTYLIYIDWIMTLFIIVTLPFITILTKSLSRSIRKYSHRSQESMEELTKVLKESLDGRRIVQSYQLEKEMISRFNKTADRVLNLQKNIIKREEAASPLSESFVAFAQAALFIYIGNRIIGGQLTFGNFTGYIFAIGLLQDSIRKLQQCYVKIQQAIVALDRIYSVFDSLEITPEVKNPVAFNSNWKTIQFKNLSFSYGDKQVLTNINLTVERGQIIALVGESGGGKSTLVSLLERFYDPNEGDILIDSIPIKNFSLSDLRKNIALVSQDSFLFNDSIEYNIRLGNLDNSSENVEFASKIANAHDFILQTPKGYLSNTGDLGQKLSGGQKQRINIARAIFKDAPIILLDEATSALDSTSEKEVQKGLNELIKGRTCFVIAHRLSTIINADRIVVLNQGKIVEVGTHKELLERKQDYFRLCQMQSLTRET